MNIHDISKLAGVSVATVSRVLNGNANVSEKTKNKVMEIIQEYNYTPNAFARGLGLNTMHTAGILCVDPADPDACPSLQFAIGYLQRELRKYNMDSLLFCVGYDMREKEKTLQAMLARRVDAIIMIGSFFVENNSNNNLCIINAAKTTPIWLLNGDLPGVPNVYCARCNDEDGAYRATKSLIDAGCKQVVCLHHGNSFSEQQKVLGYKRALLEVGLPVKDGHICDMPSDIRQAQARIEALVQSGITFDGAFTTEDEMALVLVRYAMSHNIAIPEKLKIVGYQNSKLSKFSLPELSSVDHNIESLCVTMAALLVNQLRGLKAPSVTTTMADIVYRQTLPNPYK